MALVRAATCGSRGRGLLAAHDLHGGQLVLSEQPLLVYCEAEAASSGCFCHHCTRCIVGTVAAAVCDACGRAKFCSSACIEAAKVSTHNPWACAGLSRLVALGLDSEAETQGRFLVAALGLSDRDPAAFQQLLALDGQADDQAAQASGHLHSILRCCLPALSLELALCLLAKDKKNAFGLMAPLSPDGQRRVRAYALYSQTSLFNHDCLPNACRFDYLDAAGSSNTNINVRVLHDVSAGSEICLSYFPVNWTLKERQKRLLEDYGFQCCCDRCKVEQSWSDNEDDDDSCQEDVDEDPAAAAMDEDDEDKNDFPHAMFFVKYLCPKQDCGGTMAPLSDGSATMECNACGFLRTEQAFLADLEQNGM